MAAETRWRIVNWPAWSRRTVTLCFFAAMNWMLLAPADQFESVPFLFEHEDKLLHCAISLALAWLVRWAVPGRYGLGLERWGVLAGVVLYAGAIEVLQPVLGGAGREFEWLDLASNLTGVGVGWILFGQMIDSRSAGS